MDTRAPGLVVAGPAQVLLATHAAMSPAVHMCSQEPPSLCYQGPEGSIPNPALQHHKPLPRSGSSLKTYSTAVSIR